ncbi:MAG: FAD-dependent oxidoreductase [Thermoleophilia bacterium]|jgi:glycine/D-amino acid oxidase-like deaminating enzyme|nr:FAD-dependent oxidoreductase [Thermoleophilia bacterium]
MADRPGEAAGTLFDTARAAVYWQGGDPRWQPAGVAPLTTTERADVCIVGGGFTGLWTALWIKRLAPETDVVIVEREYCGAGASGRNGGWVNGWDDALPKLVAHFGRDAALWLLDASQRGLDDIRDTVRDEAIDCDLAFDGGLVVALSPAQVDGVLEAAHLARDLGRDGLFRVLDKDEAVDLSGAPAAEAGVVVVQAGRVQPALLVQGLRRLAVAAGVRVYEATPMVGLERTLPAVVTTPSGCVTADKVVLAAGVRLSALAELRRTVFIIPSHVVATASSPDALDRLGWASGRPFADGRIAVHYAQRTASDRVVFGRGGGRLGYGGRVIAAHYHDDREIAEIVADMHAMLPATRELAVEWRWGGPMERTQHGIPWVGTLGKYRNLHYGMGYAGNGVTSSNLIGRTMASLSLELDDDYARSPLVSEPPSYLPPEPIRSAGARVVRNAIERCEVLEDQGRRPDPVSRALRRGLSVSTPKGIALWRRDRMD